MVVALAVCFAAAGIGGWFTARSVGEWYADLSKPAWTPPDSIFGPVWSLLYALMAVALWLVWRKVDEADFALPTVVFGVQLVLNVVWSMLFFGIRRPDLAFAEVILLWLAILATAVTFWPHSRLAAALLTPYLAWVGFASALNLAIWRMNG